MCGFSKKGDFWKKPCTTTYDSLIFLPLFWDLLPSKRQKTCFLKKSFSMGGRPKKVVFFNFFFRTQNLSKIECFLGNTSTFGSFFWPSNFDQSLSLRAQKFQNQIFLGSGLRESWEKSWHQRSCPDRSGSNFWSFFWPFSAHTDKNMEKRPFFEKNRVLLPTTP